MNKNIDYLQDLTPNLDSMDQNVITGYTTIQPGYTIKLGPSYYNTYGDSCCISKMDRRFDIAWERKQEEPKPVLKFPEVKRVIFNDKATVVFFDDGTKVIVKKECVTDDKQPELVRDIKKDITDKPNTGKTNKTA